MWDLVVKLITVSYRKIKINEIVIKMLFFSMFVVTYLK